MLNTGSLPFAIPITDKTNKGHAKTGTPLIYLFLIFKNRTRKRTNGTRPPTDCQLATSNGLFAN